MKNYPEHEKLSKVEEESQSIGIFLNWLQGERQIHLCEYQTKDDDYLTSLRMPISDLLSEYFKISQKRLESEKQDMLAEIRKK